MGGLGDSIYHRPFIRKNICVHTKYPELFDGSFNCGREPDISTRYDSKSLVFSSIIGAIEKFFPKHEVFKFDLPEFQKPDLGKYVVIRPPMLRTDFYAPARNPNMEYITQATHLAEEMGYTTVGVANQRGGVEYSDGPLPDVHLRYYDGQLDIPQLMGLVRGAEMVIGGPGWQVPAAIAYKVPICLIYGGAAKWNTLDKLTDPRMDLPKIHTITPDNFCRCKKVTHTCDKEISDFGNKFSACLN